MDLTEILTNFRQMMLILGAVAIVCVSLALLLFVTVIRHLKRIEVPANATFGETLMVTPFSVVLFVDLLDLGLDILAAPFVWVFLDRLGLKALRGVAVLEAAVPVTQFLPTLTVCWLGVRFLGYAPPQFDFEYDEGHAPRGKVIDEKDMVTYERQIRS
ncbi:MAG TPA: hypothetical protein VLL52_22550 [Anaerolineae bacterium]|nr:hypothetical protein [Anaerolineae bacterium]